MTETQDTDLSDLTATTRGLSANAAKLLGLPATASDEEILEAIRRLKRDRQLVGAAAFRVLEAAGVPKTSADGEALTQYARLNRLWESGIAALPAQVDRLLDAQKVPLYNEVAALTRQERIEWAFRRAVNS